MNESRYILVLEPIGGRQWRTVPPAIRLRRALKALARSFGFRVVEVRKDRSESDGKDKAA